MIRNEFRQVPNRETALVKAQKFCAYRERCVAEMEIKLKEWGLSEPDSDWIIDDLVEQNFINEERYLSSFVRGKFNNNKWGLVKIRMALRQQRFNEDRITMALKKIDRSEYEKTAANLVRKKQEELNGMEVQALRSRIYYYLVSKGYEPDLVMGLLKNV